MHNHVILTGRLTHTPELRQTPSGVSVCRFSLAVQQYNKNKKEQDTDFFEIEAWRGNAEFISRYFDKGDLVDITGRLKKARWKDDNDVIHDKTFVVVETVEFAPINKRRLDENSIDYVQAAQDTCADLPDFENITDNLDEPF